MKLIKHTLLLLILALLSLQSCLKEEDDVFGTPSAIRVQESAAEVDAILNAAPNGWVMDYFAGEADNKEGGYQMLCRFNKSQVTMAGAFTIPGKYMVLGKESKSLYKFDNSQGLVLSFTTYNDVLHLFGDAGNILLAGHNGDFEFTITEMSADKIIMTGIKHSLKIVMRPMEEGKDWLEYCKEVEAMKLKIVDVNRYKVMKDNTNIGLFTFRSAYNELNNTEEAVLETTLYTVSNKGINLYESVNVGGEVINRLEWKENETGGYFTSVTDPKVTVVPTKLAYESYLGRYSVTADNLEEPVTVTISGSSPGTLMVSDELLGYPFEVGIDGDNLTILGQTLEVDPETGNHTRLGVYTVSASFLGNSTNYNYTKPLYGTWYKGTEESPVLYFYPTVSSNILSTVTFVGIRVVVYKGNSTDTKEVIDYKTIILSNIYFTKL